MRKILTTLALILLIVPAVSASIVTNTNQSAFFLRLPARNASTDIDAVYYNPAGLTKLQNGFHIAFHNQSLFQKRTVENKMPLLQLAEPVNDGTYEGKVNAPIFPNIYAVYKLNNLVFSFGFGPNGGGGSADYANGLPQFEIPYSMIPVLVSLMGIPTNKYAADISFKGSSVYYGIQFNVAYAIHDIVSLAVGARLILANNTYEGTIQDVQINPWFILNPTAKLINASQFFTLMGNPTMAAATADQTVDAKQTGSGFTPILSLNLTPIEGLHCAIRYEFKTTLELTNKTTADTIGMFPDGAKSRHDIPAILAIGASYSFIPQLRAMFSFSYYFDKNADWDGRENFVDKNTFNIGGGLEFDITKTILVSAGYVWTQIGVLDGFQSDFAHSLSAGTVGFGGKIKVLPTLDIDLAGVIVTYKDYSQIINYGLFGNHTETYKRSSVGFAIGFTYHPKQ